MKIANNFWSIVIASLGITMLFLMNSCGTAPVESQGETSKVILVKSVDTEPRSVLDKIFYSDVWTWPYHTEHLARLNRGKFYIPVQDENKIVILDPDASDYNFKVIETDFVQPNHIWLAPGARYAYVTFQSETKGDHDALAVIDTWRDEIVKYLQTGINDPYHGSYSPVDNLFIAGDLSRFAGHIHLFNTENHELITSVETNGIQTRDVLISHNGRYAFVGHQGYDLDRDFVGSVEVLDIKTHEIVGAFGEGACAAGKVSHDGRLVFFSCREFDQIVVIDVESLTEIKRIDMPEGSGPFNLAVRPDDKYVYIGLNQAGMLGVIDVEQLELVKTLQSGTNTNDTLFHPYASLAVTTNNGTDSHVSILDTENNQIIDQIETGGKGSHNGQWTPDGRWFLVNNRLGDTVTLLMYNDETREIEWFDDIIVGFGPSGVRWVPYFCGTPSLTPQNVAEVKNAPAINADGECGDFEG